MENRVWEQLNRARLTIDHTGTLLELDRAEIEQFYVPIARFLLDRRQALQKRILAAVAGPPGVGKTAFTTQLVAVINAESGRELAVQVQQDGWHYPNSYLASHTLRRGNQEILLSQIKGAPETFDTATAYACLEKIRRGEQAGYPVYSRVLHDPIPDAGTVESHHQVVVVEGNYLFLQKDPWRQFLRLFDVRIFLAAPRAALIESLRQRFLRGGKSMAAVEQHIQEVDLLNIDLVLENSAPGNIVVYKAGSRRIARVHYGDIP